MSDVHLSDVQASQVGPVVQISHDPRPTPPPIPDSLVFDSGYISTDLPIGGWAKLFISKTGDYTFSGKVVDGGLYGFKFALTTVALTPSGLAITKQHTGSVGGTFTPGSDTDSWTETGVDVRIHDKWQDLANAQGTSKLEADFSITPEIDKALKDTLGEALTALGVACGGGVNRALTYCAAISAQFLPPGAEKSSHCKRGACYGEAGAVC